MRHRDLPLFVSTLLCLALAGSGTVVAQDGVAPAELALRATIADKIAVHGAPSETTGIVFGLHGISVSADDDSAGLVGESLATAGFSVGVEGYTSNATGVAGFFENTAGGPILRGVNGSASLIIAGDGLVIANGFAGDGSGLVGGSGINCAGCIDSSEVVNGAITASHLLPGAVGTDAINNGAVNAAKLAAGAVTTAKLAAGAVGTAKLADRAIDSAKLAFGAVDRTAIADGAVGSTAVATNAVTRHKLDAWQTRVDLLFVGHDDCLTSGQLGTDPTCGSRLCQVSPPRYLDCAGNCTATTIQSCSNPWAGFMVPWN